MKYFCIVLAHSVLWLSSLVGADPTPHQLWSIRGRWLLTPYIAATPVDIAGAVSLKERDTEVGVLYDSQDDLWNDTSYKIHTASIEFGASKPTRWIMMNYIYVGEPWADGRQTPQEQKASPLKTWRT